MDDKSKVIIINFRVSAEEKDQIQRNAKASGMSFSHYIRSQSLKQPENIVTSLLEPHISKHDKYNIYLSANILMLLHSLAEKLNIGNAINLAEGKALKWLLDKNLINLSEPEAIKGKCHE